ncbi:hypothetical protein F4780DRAFT_362587 [Xylariomycetidae sp. FL0641]|nr:hypothetical protein F4780DRAFT_362587 [Xylariomycetidae sp. FL0641]
MDDVNLHVSNGSCYWARNSPTADNFIPCGNAAGHIVDYACCQAGDTCLSSNACYNDKYGTTYLIGCTDPGYSATACPLKGVFDDQQVVGLTRCTDDPEDSLWEGCQGSDDTSQLEPADQKDCQCTGDGIFRDAATLTNVALLPSSTGASISFYPGQTPTLPTTRLSSTTQETAVASPGASSPAVEALAASSSGLSTGAKAGIGVGSVLAALLAVCVILLGIRHRRKREPAVEEIPFQQQEQGQDQEQKTPISQEDWRYTKSELPADSAIVYHEMEASTSTSPALGTPSPQYQAYSLSLAKVMLRDSEVGDQSPGADDIQRSEEQTKGEKVTKLAE